MFGCDRVEQDAMHISIKARLIVTIVFLGLLLVVIGARGITTLADVNQSLQTVYVDRVIPLQQLKVISDHYAVSVIDAVNKANAGLMTGAEALALINKATKEIDVEWAKYMATALTPEESSLAQQAQALFLPANEAVKELINFLERTPGSLNGQLSAFDGPLYATIDPIGGKITDLINLQLRVANSEYTSAQQSYTNVKHSSIVLISIGLILAAISGYLLIRAISGPLNNAVLIAQNIAKGQLNNQINTDRKDETGQLMIAMDQMQSSIQDFVRSQQELSQAHATGQLSARLEPGKYPGTFGEMAIQTNDLVDDYINLLQQTIQIIAQYSTGCFDQDMPMLSGEKQQITVAMADVKSALLAISHDIQTISSAGAAGDFSVRTDPTKYQFLFRTMLENLNVLIETCDRGFMDVLRVCEALAQGDLSQTIEQEYPGTFGRARSGVNQTVLSLRDVIGEVERMVTAAAEHGDFSVRIGAEGKQGFSLNLAKQLNQLSNVTDTGLRDVMRVASALADGDLTQSIQTSYPGIFGETGGAVNLTVENLQNLVGDIKSACDTIYMVSSEIAQGNADLSHRTESQAASLEETAASTEQLTATVAQNTENAKAANQLAANSAHTVQDGSNVVREVVDTMNNIQQAAEKIVDIISVIDGIAFQTNILALNAAVEAARAGEQGRGFAVVASEVRQLAQRSALAAKEIKVLINNSVSLVNHGSQQVNRAGASMLQIESSIAKVRSLVDEITQASIEQSAGIAQVNQTVIQLDGVTQQNAALVEEATAASESLQEQAETMMQAVSVFKTTQHNTSPVRSILQKASVNKVRSMTLLPHKAFV
jgi:methyl-accepting chemotaxis protein